MLAVEISVGGGNGASSPCSNKSNKQKQNKMDKTMYSVNGGAPLSKGRMVLEVVDGFCAARVRTPEEVRKAFGSIITEERLAKDKAEETGTKRHFLDTPLKLKGGSYVVTNQWRLDGVEKFVERAAKLGSRIEVAKGVERAPKKPAEAPAVKVDRKAALEIQKKIDELGKKPAAKKPAAKKPAEKPAAKKKPGRPSKK